MLMIYFEKTEKEEISRKTEYYTYKNRIKQFISPKRTLEYCIAMSDLLRDDL